MTMIPELPAGLTPDLLTRLLHDDGVLPRGGRVTSVAHGQVGDGTGMMAELSRLTLSYDGERGDAPATVIAKYSSRNANNRQIARTYNLPERETRFAKELGPRTTARTPRTYFSGLDDDRFLILMEDMGEYEVGSQVLGATLRQSELAIDELARLHASFWNRVDGLDWVPGIQGSYHADNMRNLAPIGVDGTCEKFGDVVADEIRTRRDAFLAAIPSMQDWMMTAPVTLAHGDFRMENLLYGCRPGHHPVVVIDWQGPLRARGMNDVALFLGQSTKTEVRREHERALLDRYRAGLEAGGVTGLDPAAMFDEYRRTILYNWVYAVVVAGTLDTSNETAFAWMARMVARQTAASHDLDVFALMP